MTRAFWRQNTFTFNKPVPLGAKYLEHFIGSAPPLFILDPLLWIGSAYVFLYINSCLGLNKALTNLTSLCQHHLQYISNKASSYTDKNNYMICPPLPTSKFLDLSNFCCSAN